MELEISKQGISCQWKIQMVSVTKPPNPDVINPGAKEWPVAI